MSKTRRKFTKEFKQEAVNMVLKGGMSKAEAARRLGINDNLVSRWVLEFQADESGAFPGNGNLKPEDEKLRQMEKEIRDLREENACLKKTASYFASQKK
jgi:transposase